jgi:hypothetical protein
MGSILLVLQNWIPEFFEYYRASGDTSIVHNEYLRVLMETGFVGGVLVANYVYRAMRVRSTEVKTLVLIVLAASLTENPLGAYSTAMLALMLIASSASATVQPRTTEE